MSLNMPLTLVQKHKGPMRFGVGPVPAPCNLRSPPFVLDFEDYKDEPPPLISIEEAFVLSPHLQCSSRFFTCQGHYGNDGQLEDFESGEDVDLSGLLFSLRVSSSLQGNFAGQLSEVFKLESGRRGDVRFGHSPRRKHC